MDINIQDYTQDRKKENMSVEINMDENSNKLSISKFITNKDVFSELNEAVSSESDEDNTTTKIRHHRIVFKYVLNELLFKIKIKQKNKKIIKLIHQNILKELLLRKLIQDKIKLNKKIKTYYYGYKVWKNLTDEPYEELDLVE